MEYYILIASILLIHIFRWFIPGPAIALIIRNSLVYSRKTGFWTAVGFAISNFANIVLVVTGVGLIIANTPMASVIIKFIGVAYLMYLGIKTFFRKTHLQNIATREKHHDIHYLSAMKIGFITNFFNPNGPLFFMSIFGSLLSAQAPRWVIISLMVTMPLNTLMMASLWSLFFSHRSIKGFYLRYQPILNKCLGGALILLAIKMAVKN